MERISESQYLSACVRRTVDVGSTQIHECMIYKRGIDGYLPLDREEANREYLAILRRNGSKCVICNCEYVVDYD